MALAPAGAAARRPAGRSQAAAPPPDPARLLARITTGEPTIAEVQAAAARHAETATPDPAELARRRRLAALLPRITAEVRHEERDYRVVGLQGTGEVDYLRSSPGTSFAVHATWELGDLVAATGEAAAAAAALARATRRDEAVQQGHRPGLRAAPPAAGAAGRPAPRRPGAGRGGAGAGAGHRRAGRADRRPARRGGGREPARPRRGRGSRLALGAGLAALPGCGPAGARAAHADRRLVARAATGAARSTLVTVDFTGPIAADGLAEGLLVALARAADARAVARAAGGGRAARPAGPRRRRRARRGRPPHRAAPAGAAGRRQPPTRWWWPRRCATPRGAPVLDPEGHRRTFVGTFSTVAGPPPRPVLTEVRAVAATPQAGGEYVELLNLGEEPLDLSGWRLEKRTSTGSLAGCTVAAAAAALPPGAFGLRRRRGLGRPLPGCGRHRPLHLRGVDAGGRPRRRPAAGGAAARSVRGAAGHLRPGWRGAALPGRGGADRPGLAPDEPANLACAVDEGTPGWCNSVTPPSRCP